jgi:tripartite-type tricarboxylate transporter receptor subunit TctC
VACLGVALASLILLVGCGQQQPFPSRPITLICPWSAGGGTDRVSRQMAMQLERRLGVPVNVINATGGSGVTGLTRGARSRPDGSTLMMMTVELSMLHWRGLTTITYEISRRSVCSTEMRRRCLCEGMLPTNRSQRLRLPSARPTRR